MSLPDWSPGELAVPYGYAGARLEPLAAADIDRDGDGIAEEQCGLYLMGARWYDPQTGRFIEQDPIGEEGGLNLYAYTGSSPISWTDPTGLRPKSRVPGVGSGPTGRGYQVKVDGRNTTDSLTGNQVYTLAYARDGGGDTKNAGDEANEPPANAASQKDAGEAKPQDQAEERTRELINKTKREGNEAEKKAAQDLVKEMQREKVRAAIVDVAAIKFYQGEDAMISYRSVKSAGAYMKFLQGSLRNEFKPSWIRATYDPGPGGQDGTVQSGTIRIFKGTWEATDAFSMSFDRFLVRAFAHEAVHALGRTQATPHNRFPSGIWMGIDP